MSNIGSNVPGTPSRVPHSRPSELPSTPTSRSLNYITAAGNRGTPNPAAKKKSRKQKVGYEPSSQGVLKWARNYHGGGNISAEQMNQFEEKFATEANNKFKNPQNATKKAK